jgi:hypothetical protein
VPVVGESHYQDNLERQYRKNGGAGHDLKVTAVLVPEHENNFDANAVRVDIEGQPVGHLQRQFAEEYRTVLGAAPPMTPSEKIDKLIAKLTDWRGKTLASVRKAILAADKEIVEEWKWMGSPVWERDGIIVVGNAHKDKVKLTFAHGASLPDPDKLFNAGLEGRVWRAIDLFDGDKIDARALKNLIRAAIEFNQGKKAKKKTSVKKAAKKAKSKRSKIKKAPRSERLFVVRESPQITASSTSRTRPDAGSSRTARPRSSSVR